MELFSDPSNFLQDHQTNLFLKKDKRIRMQLDYRCAGNYDKRKLFNVICLHEATDLIVRYPTIKLNQFLKLIDILIENLDDSETLATLSAEIKLNHTLFAKFPDGSLYEIIIRHLNFYHEEYFNESLDARELRINSFLDSIVYYLEELGTGNTYYTIDIIDSFAKNIKEIANQYYFLSDHDLKTILKWLHESYSTNTAIYSPIEEENRMVYPIQLNDRDISIYKLTSEVL